MGRRVCGERGGRKFLQVLTQTNLCPARWKIEMHVAFHIVYNTKGTFPVTFSSPVEFFFHFSTGNDKVSSTGFLPKPLSKRASYNPSGVAPANSAPKRERSTRDRDRAEWREFPGLNTIPQFFTSLPCHFPMCTMLFPWDLANPASR